MERITQRNLEALVSRINTATGNPQEPWSKNAAGKFTANIGNYHLSGAYGGAALHQMLSDGGGVRDVFGCGHISKRDLWNRMHAFLSGLDERKAA